ncbi:MAG: helix-turn-helix domain-containing protein [Clostridia bacterium]|nr:helix-turn-helix domain-containing protein [Clostridia bacterium]
MNISSNFVDNLNELMFDHQMTIKSFCEKLDIGKSEAYRFLRKDNLPTFSTIIKIADYFCCSMDYLLGLSPFLSEDKLNYTPPFNIAFKQILEEYNVTRYQINKHTKIANSRLDDWYYGKHSPNLDNVLKLAKYFDCTIDKLLGREFR